MLSKRAKCNLHIGGLGESVLNNQTSDLCKSSNWKKTMQINIAQPQAANEIPSRLHLALVCSFGKLCSGSASASVLSVLLSSGFSGWILTRPLFFAALLHREPDAALEEAQGKWTRLGQADGGALAPGSWANSWVWPWELQPSYLAQAEGALGFLCKNQSAFPLVVWLPLRRETLPSSVIVPSSSNVAQSASSRA